MKRTILKTLAVIAIFFIGASINSSCGSSHFNENTPPLGEIWETVNNLVAEVSQLKKDNELMKEEIRQLRENNADIGSNGGEWLIDGLYFSRAGYVSSKSKRWSSDNYDYTYEYDEQGRIQKQIMTINVDGLTYSTNTSVYNYSGKTVTITSTVTYTNPEMNTYTSTMIYEYY